MDIKESIEIPYERAMNSKGKELYRDKYYVIERVLIPTNYEQATYKYFIDSTNGHNYGNETSFDSAMRTMRQHSIKRKVHDLLDFMLTNSVELVSYGLAPNVDGFCYEVHNEKTSYKLLKRIDERLDALSKEQEKYLKEIAL